MKKRWLLNLALLVIVAGLGVFVWLRANDSAHDTRPALTDLSPDTVRRVAIVRRERDPIVLERTPETGWRVAAPVAARANSFAIDTLLRIVRAPVEVSVPPTDDPARYGLAKPALTVMLDDAAIRFGAMHPLKDLYYVGYRDAVYLISSRYYAQAAAPYSNYIDSRLIEEGRKPTAFKLPDFALKLDDATWRRRPELKNLSSDRINEFVDEWKHARALSVEKTSGRTAREHVTITFEGEHGKPELLELGILAHTPELVLVREDEHLEYHFPEEIGKRLLQLTAVDKPSSAE